MALSASIQNLINQANPEFASGRATPQQHAKATFGASVGQGENERSRMSLVESINLAKQKRDDIVKQIGFANKYAAFTAGEGTPDEREEFLQGSLGFTPQESVPGSSVGTIGAGFGRGPSNFMRTNETARSYYTQPAQRLGSPYKSSLQRLREFKETQSFLHPTNNLGITRGRARG